MIRKWRATVLSVAAAVLASVVVPLWAAPVAAAANSNCVPVVIIPLRGSGETSVGMTSYPGQTGGGWEGPTLHKLLREAAGGDYLRGAPILDVPAPGGSLGTEGYPAVPVVIWDDGTVENSEAVIASANEGAAAALRVYREFSQAPGCADPKVVFVGYSQGAMAARTAANTLNITHPGESRVAGVFAVGDPLQKPNADGVYGSGSDGQGIFRVLLGDYNDTFYTLPGVDRVSICHDEDVICAVGPPFKHDTHLTYFNDGMKFVTSAGASPSPTSEVEFMSKALHATITKARLAYGMGPKIEPVKDVYAAGDSVTATYSLERPAAAGDRLMMYNLYQALEQCQVGMAMSNRSGTAPPDALDIIQITANSQRLTSIASLLGYSDPIALTPGSTAVSVQIALDNDALKNAAVTKFQPGPLYPDEDRFDLNGNGKYDGTEAYAAYEHALSGRCGGLDATGPGTNWFADIMNSNNDPVRTWRDSPPLRLRLLATGLPADTAGYARGQALRLNITGLTNGATYGVYFESDPVLLTTVTAGSNGTATANVAVPPDAQTGEHHIVLRKTDNGEVARVALTVATNGTPGPVIDIPVSAGSPSPESPSGSSSPLFGSS
ncbi:cutinase family protein [Williamsia sp. DF01-3]|uniref:cutinase family protein n=1 Tax=Williamsia sp. DF01-3 TaxID=2934157 RepID=UPI001FF48C9B|nr:cutinase family protein [Williamsia sp. DF01-3]MCK0515698.1 cutinase family protein [Williamsia sp. DF01-3]